MPIDYQNFLLYIGRLILSYIYGLSFQLVAQLSHLVKGDLKVIEPVLPIPSIRTSVTHNRGCISSNKVLCVFQQEQVLELAQSSG